MDSGTLATGRPVTKTDYTGGALTVSTKPPPNAPGRLLATRGSWSHNWPWELELRLRWRGLVSQVIALEAYPVVSQLWCPLNGYPGCTSPLRMPMWREGHPRRGHRSFKTLLHPVLRKLDWPDAPPRLQWRHALVRVPGASMSIYRSRLRLPWPNGGLMALLRRVH